MRLLLDENIAFGLLRELRSLQRYVVVHAQEAGLTAIPNGNLIAAAEQAGFDVLVTADQNLSYQQNMSARTLGIIVISTPHWPVQRLHLAQIVEAVDRSGRGCFLEVMLPRPPLNRRPPPFRP